MDHFPFPSWLGLLLFSGWLLQACSWIWKDDMNKVERMCVLFPPDWIFVGLWNELSWDKITKIWWKLVYLMSHQFLQSCIKSLLPYQLWGRESWAQGGRERNNEAPLVPSGCCIDLGWVYVIDPDYICVLKCHYWHVCWNFAIGMVGHEGYNWKNWLMSFCQKILEAGEFSLTSSSDWLKECKVWKFLIENNSTAMKVAMAAYFSSIASNFHWGGWTD